MESWWLGLSFLNKAFAVSALTFTVLFLWQILAVIIGMDTDTHGAVDAGGIDHGGLDHAGDSGGDHTAGHGADAVTLTFVSIRSGIAFGTLFSWAGTLYLASGTPAILAIVYSAVWGLIAMFAGRVYALLAAPSAGMGQRVGVDRDRRGRHRVHEYSRGRDRQNKGPGERRNQFCERAVP